MCGKGPQAAAVTSLTRYTLRAAAHHDPEPAAAPATLNAVLHERYTGTGDPRYRTCVFGILEPGADGRTAVHLASGGHPPALVLRADGHAAYLPTPGGLLVGVVPRPTRDDLYGEEALLAFVTEHAPAPPHAVITALTEPLEGFGDGLDDDTALLATGVPAHQSATRPATNPS